MSDHFPDRLLFAGSLLVAAVAAVVWYLLRQIDRGVSFPAGAPR